MRIAQWKIIFLCEQNPANYIFNELILNVKRINYSNLRYKQFSVLSTGRYVQRSGVSAPSHIEIVQHLVLHKILNVHVNNVFYLALLKHSHSRYLFIALH